MMGIAHAVAWLVALAIIGIGAIYVAKPRAATPSFGLPPPDGGRSVDAWLRLKGIRDIASGLVVLAMIAWSGWRVVGIVLLVETLVPAADMLTILASKGSAKRAIGIHGATAAAMLVTAVSLLASTY